MNAANGVRADFQDGQKEVYKTFAYISGVESLVRMQLNPELLNNWNTRAVVRELTAKGLREVRPDENMDLVVRYWVEAESNAQLTLRPQKGVPNDSTQTSKRSRPNRKTRC